MPDYSFVLQKQREFFARGGTLDLRFRIEALMELRSAIVDHEAEIMDALKADLGKSPAEAYATEIGMVLHEISNALSHLPRWARARRAAMPLVHFPSFGRIIPEPYGLALIISPWNYPVQLTLTPLVGAIAAGNCAAVKPSAYSPAASAVLAKLLRSRFGPEYVAVFEGGREANSALLAERFDYIFFTGSLAVGKTVMEAAARYLTPVTLELGGKSPCIVCADADVGLAARRIMWGKTLNAGQTCVAPDYVLAHESIARKLMEAMKGCVRQFFGPDPCANDEYSRIVNAKHFERIAGYLGDGEIFFGGRTDTELLKIEPTVLSGVSPEAPVMREEVFGPVLPVLTFKEAGDAIAFVRERPKPLALYLFTTDRKAEKELLRQVSFGGGCINDTVVHFATTGLPTGGVGQSGMGQYHGKWSFDTFTHYKGVLRKSTMIDVPLRYPPYGGKLGLFRRMLK